MPDHDPERPEPRLGDTLGTGGAGRVDPEAGATQGGTRSHERASYSDPITLPRSDTGAAADRVPGAASVTPEYDEAAGRTDPPAPDESGRPGARTTSRPEEDRDAPMRGAGTPVRRAGPDGLPSS